MRLSPAFITKIIHALEEEETDIFTLTLYSIDNDDMNYFTPSERETVKKIFKTLMDDTRKHAELLKLIVDMAS